MKISKEDALSKLRSLKDESLELEKKTYGSSEFQKWWRNTETELIHIFGDNTRNVKDFRSLPLHSSIYKSSPDQVASQNLYVNGLEKARILLETIMDEIEKYGDVDPHDPINSNHANLPAEAPTLIKNLQWIWLHWKKHWVIILLAALILISPQIYKFYNQNPEEHQNERETLLMVQSPPSLVIIPEDIVEGSPGKFQLSLTNRGLSDVSQIKIYEDYYVALSAKDEPIKLYEFGLHRTRPNTTIESLKKNETKKFTINFESILEEMSQFYRDESKKGKRMKIARIKIELIREIDGMSFSHSKAYIIAGHGDRLFDYSSSRDIKYEFDAYSYGELKQILGIPH